MRKTSDSTNKKPVTRVGHLISLLNRVLHNEKTLALAPLGLTPPQFIALFILHSRGRLSNAELARVSHMTPQSTNKVVQFLASKKYISHTQNPEHKRILHIEITPKGIAILQKADHAVMAIEGRMFERNSTGEQKLLEQLLLGCLSELGTSVPPVQ